LIYKTRQNKTGQNKMKTLMIYIDALDRYIEYYIGVNAEDNFTVIDSSKGTDDIWFHVGNGLPSCHVLAIVPRNVYTGSRDKCKKNKRYIVKQGALICKQYSKYSAQKDLEIHYCAINNVTKTDVLGSVTLSSYSSIII
jgi:hypothetical protein